MLFQYLELFLAKKRPSTQTTYRQIVAEWASFVGDEKATFCFDRSRAFSFLLMLRQKPGLRTRYDRAGTISARTTNKYIMALRGFYKFLIEVGACKENHFASRALLVEPPNISQKRPIDSLSPEEAEGLLNTPRGKCPRGIRDRAYLTLLFASGGRLGTILSVELQDLKKTPSGTWYIEFRRVKGGGDHCVALSEEFVPAIMACIEQRRKEGAGMGDYILTGYLNQTERPTHNRLDNRRALRIFKYYANRAGLPDFISPHWCRATSITKLDMDGVSERSIQEFSGHKSRVMVEHYIKRKRSIDRNPGKFLSFKEKKCLQEK